MKRGILSVVLLSLYLLETDSINVRKGIFNPIDESFDINDHERISEFIPTAQSTFKYRTQQKYQGIPIFGAKLVFEQDNDKMEPSSLENDFVQPVFGKYVNKQQLSNKIPSVQPQLSKDEALKYALDSISITEDKLYGNVDINLYIYFVHQDPYLSYIVKLSYHDDISIYQPMIIVNANNGDILNTYDNKKNFLDACGDGGNPKFGKVRYCGSKAFKINDGVNPVLANHYVQVYSNDNEDVFNKAQSFLIPASLNSTSGDYNIDDGVANEGYCAACDAFEFSNFVFDIFQTYLGENPVADKHIPLKAYVHVGVNWEESSYDDINGAINFGDGGNTRYPLAVIDLVGHEIGHGYTAKTSGLLSTGQAGAIDNSFSDLIGEVTEYYYTGSNDWKIGSYSYKKSLGSAAAERYMYNPGLNGQLNTYDDYTASSSAYEASGIYNRAIYILNNQYSWDIPQLFQVFSKANKLYWTESIGFDDALCGLYEALADEYGTNSTKLLLLEDELEDAFSQVSLSCERNQTITICGDDPNSYCIYKDVVPSTTEAKVFTAEANLENNYEYWWLGNGINATVEFKILDNPCISPEISFAYEDIDLQWDTQYIDVFDAEENLIERCGSEDECGQWNTTCINSRKLGLLQIEPNNVYTVTIRVPSGVNAWCWEHNYAVRAKIKLKCNLDTPEPTAPVPSAAPITFAPTVPTVEPTAPTTAYPTHQIIDCSGTDDNGTYTQRYCYFEDVNANTENQTVSTVRITNEAEFAFRYYDINYTIQNYDCIDPKITFTYETIDYDLSSEYLQILDGDGNQIGYNCQGGQQCDIWSTCLQNMPLGTTRIAVGESIKFTVVESDQVNALCSGNGGHSYSINALFDLICEGGTPEPSLAPTTKPTQEPSAPTTPSPSVSPTVPTTTPTKTPTPYRQCDWNRVCYDVPVTYDASTKTSQDTSVEIQWEKLYYESFYQIDFRVDPDSDKCVNPSISFNYEQIDYNDIDEYLDLFDMDGNKIIRCANESVPYACNAFDQCLTNYNLGISVINPNDTYTMTISKPSSIDAECLNHSWAINAVATLTCDIGTTDPTTDPTPEPTDQPTTPTADPTPSPTYYAKLCETDPPKYCYHPNIFPSATEDTVWEIAIQNTNHSVEWYFDIFITTYEFDCVEPSLSLEFERIDNNGWTEDISISGFYNDEFTFFGRCGGEYWMNNVCGVMEQCQWVNRSSLNINRIKQHDSYKLQLIQGDGIEPECDEHDLALNVKLTLFCAGKTSEPTTDPTKEPTPEPTSPTENPTLRPTESPTDPTVSPTLSPTHNIQNCTEAGGDITFCVHEDIYPDTSTGIYTHDIVLTQPDYNADTQWKVYVTSIGEECIQPDLTVYYEGIDYDGYGEYLNITDADGSILEVCGCWDSQIPFGNSDCTFGAAFSCGVYQLCAANLDLSKQKIGKGVTTMIAGLGLSRYVDPVCWQHDLSMNVTLRLSCNQDDSVLPTVSPTPEPSASPTVPTVNPTPMPSAEPTVPTVEPTPSPTYLTYMCGPGNEFCIHVVLYPDLDMQTDYDVPIQYYDINRDVIFNVEFKVGGDIECALPRLSFNMEMIDYDAIGEYINITGFMNDERNFYQICQDPFAGDTCEFKDCFTSNALGSVQKIGLEDTYKVVVEMSDLVDAQCFTESGHLYAINSVLTLSCAAGTTPPTTDPTTAEPTSPTEEPSPQPTTSPTEVTQTPTRAPTWSYPCGENTWCYPLSIFPSATADTFWTIPIQFGGSTSSNFFDDDYFRLIYHVSQRSKNTCNDPKLTFVFETIDYDSFFEHINITDVAQNSVIATCGGDSDYACNVFETCIAQESIKGVSKIELDEEYEILISLSSSVDALCSRFGNPYTLNATLELKCEGGTAKPTPGPTPAPSDSPTSPTGAPTTAQPTPPTLSPTFSPTRAIEECSTNDGLTRYCIDIEMYPSLNSITTYPVKLVLEDSLINAHKVYDVSFTAIGNDCVDPKISFEYETIDYDQYDEYINITGSNGITSKLISQCAAGDIYDSTKAECGEVDQCLNRSSIGVSKIANGDTYTVSVMNSREVDSLCWPDHEFILNAELILICSDGTATPTRQPTPEPTDQPTTPTVEPTPYPTDQPTPPTVDPTMSPTYRRTLCDRTLTSFTWCYFIDIYPEDEGVTSTTVELIAPDDDAETHFEITFGVNGPDCRNPTLTFKYENIDLDGLDEYIEIFNNDGKLLEKCGDTWECGSYDYCLKNYELNTFRNYSIKSNENYTVTVIEQGEVDALCNFGPDSYSLNAELTLTCGSVVANNATNPSGTRCGPNTYCYERSMYPSKLTSVTTSQEVIHFNDEVATNFEVVFRPINEKCYDPEIQFIYERIDFDGWNEWIKIYDNSSEELATCGAGKYTPNECNVFDACIQDSKDEYGLHLGLDYIEMSDEYRIKLTESSQVDAHCGNYSINGIVFLTCNKDPGITQYNKTVEISGASAGRTLPFETTVFNTDYANRESRFEVTFKNTGAYDCLRPTFTMTSDIKVSAANKQNTLVYDNYFNEIGECLSRSSPVCPYSDTCVSEYTLNDTIFSGDSYTFTIYELLTFENGDWCDADDNTIRHKLTLTCDARYPTKAPTPEPTDGPTVVPTTVPTTAPTGSNRADVFDLYLVNVKLNKDDTYSMIFLSESDEYVGLNNAKLVSNPLGADYSISTTSLTQVRGNKLCNAADAKCLKYWSLDISYSGDCTSSTPFDLSGDYVIEFDVVCRAGNTNNRCDNYLSSNNIAGNSITLTAAADYTDEICDTSLYSTPFTATFGFYTDVTFGTIASATASYSDGDSVFIQLSVSGSSYINNIGVNNIFVCSSDDDLTMNSSQIIDGNGGCLAFGDVGSVINIYPQTDELYNPEIYSTSSDIIRFAFNIRNPSKKDKLFVQVNTNVGLQSSANRRRALLQTNDATQTRSYLTSTSVEITVSETTQEPQGQTGGGDTGSSGGAAVIIVVIIIIVLILIIVGYWYKKRKDKGEVSWQQGTELGGGRIDDDGGKTGGYSVPMATGGAGGVSGGYDETPINPDGEDLDDEDPEIDALDDEDGGLTVPKKKKYAAIETNSPRSPETGDGDNETDVFVE